MANGIKNAVSKSLKLHKVDNKSSTKIKESVLISLNEDRTANKIVVLTSRSLRKIFFKRSQPADSISEKMLCEKSDLGTTQTNSKDDPSSSSNFAIKYLDFY